jgi:hypothetical protein
MQFHLRLLLPSVLFPPDFITGIMLEFLFSLIYAIFPVHFFSFFLFDPLNTIYPEKHITKLLVMRSTALSTC